MSMFVVKSIVIQIQGQRRDLSIKEPNGIKTKINAVDMFPFILVGGMLLLDNL
jgi:hypothetical protein